jgi:hypothetical protein|tara:strand:+ start:2791 stop:3006 length:216 start_codon:yes stop_codon:yes gene_type:complete
MAVKSITITKSLPIIKEEVSVTVTIDDTVQAALYEARKILYEAEKEQAMVAAMLGTNEGEGLYGTKIMASG